MNPLGGHYNPKLTWLLAKNPYKSQHKRSYKRLFRTAPKVNTKRSAVEKRKKGMPNFLGERRYTQQKAHKRMALDLHLRAHFLTSLKVRMQATGIANHCSQKERSSQGE